MRLAILLLLTSFGGAPGQGSDLSRSVHDPANTPDATLRSDESRKIGAVPCDRLSMGNPTVRTLRRSTVEDLSRLRDFGASGLDVGGAPGFAVSPAGDRLVVQVRQASAEANLYCQALMIFDLDRRGEPPLIIPIGHELSRKSTTWDGLAAFQLGDARPLTPRWSPDGRRIAFVQRRNGFDGLFVVPATGGTAVAIATLAANVQTFDWSADGGALQFEADTGLQAALAELSAEGRGGYRYDERYWIQSQTVPHPIGRFQPSRYRAVIPHGDLVAEPVSVAVADDEAAADGDRAWITIDELPKFSYRTRLRVQLKGIQSECRFEACSLPAAAWLIAGTDEVVFVRQEGYARSQSAVYRWRVGRSRPQRLLATNDALTGCEIALGQLFCGRERSAFPRDIVAIDCTSGKMRIIADLNPQWREIAPVGIRRLEWKNEFGIPAIGDLVLPGQSSAKPVPLVIVQYNTRGFLRGGVGDEYPIRPMVDAGFAVLSVSRPQDYNIWLARQGLPVNQRKLAAEWTDRASVHSSLLEGIAQAEKHVVIDKDHVAITGLSDGSSAANYALIHSRVFSLALLSTCCEEPDVFTTAIGPAYDKFLKEYEYPVPWEEHKDSWQKISLAMNAKNICAAIQIQAADSEARGALTTFTKLRQAGVPIEMYIFPDEYHVKWQPAHRMAVYRRNLATLAAWRDKAPVSCFKAREPWPTRN